jgi:uncharacterized surface protein with fasciclin (FAS1) repeats
MKIRIVPSLAAAAAVAAVLSAPAAADCGSAHAGAVSHETNPATSAANQEEMNIVETAASAGSFKTLLAAVQAADLGAVLQGEGPFTVFAPTDEAFAKLPEGTLEDLLKPENKSKLQAILTYHVVPGKVLSSSVVERESIQTVQGQKARIHVDDGKVKIDDALITRADIDATNGVIHVIDRVILPQL